MYATAGGICFVILWLIRLWEHHFHTKPRGTSTGKTGPLPIRFVCILFLNRVILLTTQTDEHHSRMEAVLFSDIIIVVQLGVILPIGLFPNIHVNL